jgi:hypothetical protein
MEEWSKAEGDYDKALSLSPGASSAICGLSLLPDGYLSKERTEKLLASVESGADFEDLPKKLFTKANLLSSLKDWDKSFINLVEANALRKAESSKPVDAWKKKFVEMESTLRTWVPIHSKSEKNQRSKLLVILGNSRSGKTTLERLLCKDPSFFRGYEACGAGAATSALQQLASTSLSLAELDRSEATLKVLFPSNAEQISTGNHRVLTITNPFLLPAAHLIHDLYAESYFVFMKRNPLDNAAEIFKTDYKNRYSFAYCPHAAFEYVNVYNQVASMLMDRMGARAMEMRYDEVFYSSNSVVQEVYRHLGIYIPSNSASKEVAMGCQDHCSPYREEFAKLISIK